MGNINPLSTYKEEYKTLIVDLLKQGKTLTAFRVKYGIPPTTLYQWREQHPDFDAACIQAIEASRSFWEDVLENGVLDGERKLNHQSLQFLLKNRYRKEYGDKQQIDVSADVKQTITFNYEPIPDRTNEELDELHLESDERH